MKNIASFVSVLALLALAACTPSEKSPVKEEQPVIGKKDLKLTSDLMTPEVLWSFGRVGEVAVSPDNATLLFNVGYYDIPLNKGNRDLYTMAADGSNFRQVTKTSFSENNPLWHPGGKRIGYLSAESGSMQIWEADADGNNKKQVSAYEGDITGFKYSPDGKKVLFIAEVKVDPTVKDLYPDLDKTSGRLMNDLMYRHWDSWVDTYSHLFVADYDGSKLTNISDLLEGESFETPLKPFGGMEQINWSPAGDAIAYTSKKLKGKAYAQSTNSDIYLYDLATKQTTNLSEGMMGFDISPVFSPDGRKLAWESMERDGYESDKNRLFVYDFATKERKEYTTTFDQDVHGLAWSADGKNIYFTSGWHGTEEIYRLDVEGEVITKITAGIHDYLSVMPAGDRLIGLKQSMAMPTEIFAVNPTDGKETQLTFVNKDLLGQLTMAQARQRWIKTTDNKDMLTWVIYPPHFDSTRTYPALLYCQGGPQSMVGQFWSYRWNFQMMAANGYIVVAPNRRGVPGFGQAWNEQISGDYGGQNMKDYLSAIDEVAKEPYVNKDRLGAVGASYGGFSVLWLAGNHNKRFKAFIAHDGMFNFESQYLETEEMWFEDWDIGGPFWDKNNAVAQRSYANSPHRFVQNWDTPILIIHSELDYRISYTQGMSAYNAAVLRGIPAQFLFFPDENHWVLKPQNGVLWQRTFFAWLDKYLKK